MWSAQSDDVVVPGPGFAVGDDSLGEQLLGAEASRVEILSGLSAGERIVTSGNFLIDSESQMQASLSGAGVKENHHDQSHH